MFNSKTMDSFFNDEKHRPVLTRIEEVRKILRNRFFEAEDGIDAIILAATCGFPCLLVGPPGVAKSLLIRDFCRLMGLNLDVQEGDADNREYFEYLLTQFTEPTELFGSFQLTADKAAGGKSLVRIENGMLHRCRVAFLDEVFNGSSAILNNLLALMNERVFHDHGVTKKSNLSLIFGATNEIKTTGSLAAVYDRFILRAHMVNVEPLSEGYRNYLQKAVTAQSTSLDDQVFPGLLDNVVELVQGYDAYQASGGEENGLFDWSSSEASGFLENLSYLVQIARGKGIGSFSNRRINQLTRAICMQRFMRATREGTGGDWTLAFDDYEVIWKFFLDLQDPIRTEDLEALENLEVMAPIAEKRA